MAEPRYPLNKKLNVLLYGTAVIATLGLAPYIARAGTWSDDFDKASPAIGATESAWTEYTQSTTDAFKNSGKLELEKTSTNNEEVYIDTLSTLGVQSLQCDFDVPSGTPSASSFGIVLEGSSNSIELRFVPQLSQYRFTRNLIDLETNTSNALNSFTLRINYDGSGNYSAEVIEDGSSIVTFSTSKNLSESSLLGKIWATGGPGSDPFTYRADNFVMSATGLSRNILHGEKNTEPEMEVAWLMDLIDEWEDITDALYIASATDPNSGQDIQGVTPALEWFRYRNPIDATFTYQFTGLTVPSASTAIGDYWKFRATITDNPPEGSPKTSLPLESNEAEIRGTSVDDWKEY